MKVLIALPGFTTLLVYVAGPLQNLVSPAVLPEPEVHGYIVCLDRLRHSRYILPFWVALGQMGVGGSRLELWP